MTPALAVAILCEARPIETIAESISGPVIDRSHTTTIIESMQKYLGRME